METLRWSVSRKELTTFSLNASSWRFGRVLNMRLHIANQVNPLLPGVASGHYDIIKIKLQQDVGVS